LLRVVLYVVNNLFRLIPRIIKISTKFRPIFNSFWYRIVFFFFRWF